MDWSSCPQLQQNPTNPHAPSCPSSPPPSYETLFPPKPPPYPTENVAGPPLGFNIAALMSLPQPYMGCPATTSSAPPSLNNLDHQEPQYPSPLRVLRGLESRSAVQKPKSGDPVQCAGAISKTSAAVASVDAAKVEGVNPITRVSWVKEVQNEVRSNIAKIIISQKTPLPKDYAHALHGAIHGSETTDETVLIEILYTLTNVEIRAIIKSYKHYYCRPLENDLKRVLTGDFKLLMLSLCEHKRDEHMTSDPGEARVDAKALLKISRNDHPANVKALHKILCRRSYSQLRLDFQMYESVTDQNVEELIKEKFHGDAENGYLTIVQFIKNPPAFFAKCLYESMKGSEVNESNLTRIVATRLGIDMKNIKTEYLRLYGRSLASDVENSTVKHRKCLLGLIAEA